MTSADWAILVPAVVGVLGAITALIRQRLHAANPDAHTPAPPS